MKNNVVKALALLLSVNCCFHGMLVKAEEAEDKTGITMGLLSGSNLENFGDQSKILQGPLKIAELPQFDSSDIPSLLKYQADGQQVDSEEEKDDETRHLAEVNNEEKNKENDKLEDTGLKQLQIPQKLDVVIDPWEMDGKGQIYSEEYIIRNDGETSGMLTLSNLACKVSKQSGAVVAANRAGLHDGDEKFIYMQMIFGNGDQVDLSEDGSTYQVELQPGEELSICFEGEVNEYASESWKDGDIAVTVVYSWDLGQTLENTDEKKDVSKDVESESGTEEAEETKKAEEDENISRNADLDVNDEESGVNEEEEQADQKSRGNGGATKEGGESEENPVEEKKQTEESAEGKTTEIIQSGDGIEKTEEKEIPEVIGLKDFNPVEFVVDRWEKDEEGHLCSVQYLVRNEGETAGAFALSNLLYTYAKQSGIDILPEGERISDSKSASFHMELVLENGDKIDFTQNASQEDSGESGYKVVLKPGEELKIQFVGELESADSEEFQKGNIIMKAIGSWGREETIAE